LNPNRAQALFLVRPLHWPISPVDPILPSVLRYLHTISAILFYALGLSFFAGYILMRNEIMTNAALNWLRIGDLPLLVSGLLYGGLSVYLSLKNDESASKTLMLGILIPMGILLILLLAVNFWPA
jgi:hypothetical protein